MACIPSATACTCGSTTYNSVTYYVSKAVCGTTDLQYNVATCSNASYTRLSLIALFSSALISIGLSKL